MRSTALSNWMRRPPEAGITVCRSPLLTSCPLGTTGHDALVREWLKHTDSLTARIRSRCSSFRLRVLYQGTDQLRPVERLLLGEGRICHAREVLLMADGRPVVWARTVLPRASLRGAWRFLGRLGTRPLGERLFIDPRITRSPFAFLPLARVPAARHFRAARVQRPVLLAARCALLSRAGDPALLTEALLPAIRTLGR